MRDLTISTMIEDGFKNKNRFKGTFLHGKIEDDYKHDIFSFDRKQQFDEGVHHLIINKKDVTFFLKKGKILPYRGLMVYTKDEIAYKYALDKYVTNSENF